MESSFKENSKGQKLSSNLSKKVDEKITINSNYFVKKLIGWHI